MKTFYAGIPKRVQAALEHVRKYHPEVVQVFFGVDGRWRYMDEDMKAPEFSDDINTGILEDAMYDIDHLPVAFGIDNWRA